jgi:mono/diheme cytochrome c family protein
MSDKHVFSVLGLYDSPQALMKAIPEVKENISERLEAYTPYPIHGIDKVLGIRKSPVGGMVLVMGVIGALSILAFEMWTSGRDYPLITAGKPLFSWEAFIPIAFEVTVLFATLTAGLGMLFLLNRLPRFRHPMLRSRSLPLITRDRFALSVESSGRALDVEAIAAALRQSGATVVEILEQPAPPGLISSRFLVTVLGAVAISSLAAGILTYWAMKLFPVSVPMVHMLDQPRLDPQRPSRFFKDGFGMRLPPPETVMRGSVPYTIQRQELARVLANPMPRTKDVFNKGRQAFNTYCSVCHGILGNGAQTLTAAYGAKSANLVSQQMIDLPDGQIYHVLMAGKNSMPPYSAELDEEERWAVVHFVRALQRALNARDEDVPE